MPKESHSRGGYILEHEEIIVAALVTREVTAIIWRNAYSRHGKSVRFIAIRGSSAGDRKTEYRDDRLLHIEWLVIDSIYILMLGDKIIGT